MYSKINFFKCALTIFRFIIIIFIQFNNENKSICLNFILDNDSSIYCLHESTLPSFSNRAAINRLNRYSTQIKITIEPTNK